MRFLQILAQSLFLNSLIRTNTGHYDLLRFARYRNPRRNGTSGTVIQDSTVTVDGSGNFSGVAALNNGATATTQSQGDNSTKIATTAYVDTGLARLSLDNLSDAATGYSHGTMFVGQGHGTRVNPSTSYFGFGFRLRLIALQPQRRDSGFPRGVTCSQDSQASQRKQARSSLNAATTGSKSFFPKFAHSL
jgi:hypothetical protein